VALPVFFFFFRRVERDYLSEISTTHKKGRRVGLGFFLTLLQLLLEHVGVSVMNNQQLQLLFSSSSPSSTLGVNPSVAVINIAQFTLMKIAIAQHTKDADERINNFLCTPPALFKEEEKKYTRRKEKKTK